MPERVALVHVRAYEPDAVKTSVIKALQAIDFTPHFGQRILVKPNLLTNVPLACTHPAVVTSTCAWLLDHGVKLIIADSPAFGSAQAVANSIGLNDALRPLGMQVRGFGRAARLRLHLPDMNLHPAIGVAQEALEADLILSMPKVKAHSQLRITLAVKNCYGVICGLRKAIAHARFGSSLELFCDCVVALWRQLPPVVAVCDGITAMSKTGPIKGMPFQLNLIAASPSASAADSAILEILHLPDSEIPLVQALARVGVNPCDLAYPLLRPADFSAQGFEVPKVLKEISFNPLYLGRSLLKRIWLERSVWL